MYATSSNTTYSTQPQYGSYGSMVGGMSQQGYYQQGLSSQLPFIYREHSLNRLQRPLLCRHAISVHAHRIKTATGPAASRPMKQARRWRRPNFPRKDMRSTTQHHGLRKMTSLVVTTTAATGGLSPAKRTTNDICGKRTAPAPLFAHCARSNSLVKATWISTLLKANADLSKCWMKLQLRKLPWARMAGKILGGLVDEVAEGTCSVWVCGAAVGLALQ